MNAYHPLSALILVTRTSRCTESHVRTDGPMAGVGTRDSRLARINRASRLADSSRAPERPSPANCPRGRRGAAGRRPLEA